MLRGFYTAASGMIMQQRQQEALANNVANANTPGYKADQPMIRAFPEILMQKVGAEKIPTTEGFARPLQQPIGSLHTGVYLQEMVPNFMQGDLKETGIATDLALLQTNIPDENGGLFFTVQNEEGELRLTRNGHFTVDGEGMLVTHEGYYVLDTALNPIYTDGLDFIVQSDGTLQVEGEEIPLAISYVENTLDLEKEGENLFSGEVAPDIPEDVIFSVEQGFLERSNVDSLQTMTDMMEAYRLFETNQRVLRAYDESLDKAVNDVGRLG